MANTRQRRDRSRLNRAHLHTTRVLELIRTAVLNGRFLTAQHLIRSRHLPVASVDGSLTRKPRFRVRLWTDSSLDQNREVGAPPYRPCR